MLKTLLTHSSLLRLLDKHGDIDFQCTFDEDDYFSHSTTDFEIRAESDKGLLIATRGIIEPHNETFVQWWPKSMIKIENGWLMAHRPIVRFKQIEADQQTPKQPHTLNGTYVCPF